MKRRTDISVQSYDRNNRSHLPHTCLRYVTCLEAGQASIWLMRPTVAEERLACMRHSHLSKIEFSYTPGHELLENNSIWLS